MLEAFEPVLIRTPGETSQAKNRKNRPTTYGGMRQTCMHAKMATATSAMATAVGIGSNRINAAPRRGGEVNICHASFGLRHPCSKRITASARINKHSVQCIGACAVPSNTILLLWRKATSTSINTLYQMQGLPYVIRIATTGQRLKMTASVLFKRLHCATLCVCAGSNPNTAVLWWEPKQTHRVTQRTPRRLGDGDFS